MEQLLITAMAVALAATYCGGVPVAAVAGLLMAVCCAGLTQWSAFSRSNLVWLPSTCCALAVAALPLLLTALPGAAYACARVLRCDSSGDGYVVHDAPDPRFPVSSRIRAIIALCAALAWLPACVRLIAMAATGTSIGMSVPPSREAMLACMTCLFCVIAFMLGHARRGLAYASRSSRHAKDARRAMARDMAARLASSAEERDIAMRMATLDERTRIARDIHDNVGHLLTRAIMQTEASKIVSQARGDMEAVRALEEIGGTLHEAMTMMRRSVHDLADEGTDFPSMVEEAARCSSALDVQVTNDVTAVPAPVARCCVALIREALANTVHHGTATHAEVVLRDFPAFWQIAVQDDGGRPRTTGSAGPEISRGMGLADIEARVRALDGTCAYGPNGPGWRVFASIPKRDSAPSRV